MKDNLGKGAIFLVLSLWVLSALDSSGKWIQSAGVSLAVLIWFRYGVHAVLLTAYAYAYTKRRQLRWSVRSKRVQVLRAAMMVASSALFFKTLTLMPLAEATAINFTAPMITLVLSTWLLKEAGRWYRWVAVAIAFAGVVIVLQPQADFAKFLQSGSLWAIATAISFSLYHIATRWVAADDPITTNLWAGWVGTAIASVGLFWFWKTPQLDTFGWVILLSTGVTGLIGHLFQVSAYRNAPANALAPFSYFQVFSAVGFGMLFFGQVPNAMSLIGMAIICASGITVAIIDKTRG